MEFNYRAVDERAHSSDRSPLSRYNYFTEQPTRGGYSAVGMRRDNEYFQSSVREAIHRELEKERTREGFVEENAGRRAVEDDLRRDLRMEKELGLRGRGVDEVGRFPVGIGMRVEDRRMAVSEERSLEERTREGFVEENAGRRAVEDNLRRDLRMEKELALRGRGVDEVGRFQVGMGMRVEDRRMTVSEERSLEERTREGFVEENAGRRAVEDDLRRDLRMEKELALRGRGVDEVGRFQVGMGMRVEDRRMTVSEERSLVERIAKTVEERIASSLEGRIVMALERSGMVERIARTVEERIAISLEGRIAMSLERFGTAARRGIGERPLVPISPGRVERMVQEVVQPPGHVVKEVKSDANRCDTNAPPKQGERKAESSAVSKNIEKEDWSCANRCDTNAPPKQGERKAASTAVAKNIVKEDWSCANRCDTNAPPRQGMRMTASTNVAKNIVKEHWSCSLCKVNTTSKRALEDHARGKKHKLKEASLNSGNKRKNSDNVLPPNKKAHFYGLTLG